MRLTRHSLRNHWHGAGLNPAMICCCLLLCLLLAAAPDWAWGETATPASQVSFYNEVMPLISKAGCNLGSCHGNANGKASFKLSLRGQDPDDDHVALTKDFFARRIQPNDPDNSLLLLKATTEVAHEGGKRFGQEDKAYALLKRWITQGAPKDPDKAILLRLEVTPLEQVIVQPMTEVQLNAIAHFSNGSRDVTSLAVYEPSNTLAEVTGDGLVSSVQAGESTIMVRFLEQQVPVRLAFVEARPNFVWQAVTEHNQIDTQVFAKLRKLRMQPSGLATDTAFVRRAYLDLLGRIPTGDEAKAFVKALDDDKRAKLIEDLLESPGFADFWALKWGDLLKNEEKALDRRGVARFHRWIRNSLLDNLPMDQFAYQILRSRGSTYQNPQANFYRTNRTPVKRAETAAQVFLGTRLQCAQCHNHPFDRWSQDDYYDWTTLFARVDYKILENRRRDSNDKNEFIGEQVVFLKQQGEVTNPRRRKDAVPRFLGGDALPKDVDRLEALARWVTSPDNPRFAPVQVNRVWFHLMGRGLVDPVDDFRNTNLASHPELLDTLTEMFIASGFDLRHLIKTIMRSRTYQLSSEPNASNAHDEINYAYQQVRRLTAEQLVDSLSTAADVPVAFNGYPLGTRAAQIPGVQAFKPSSKRPTSGDRFLISFGKPPRLMPSETERSNSSTMGQAFELMTGPLITKLLDGQGNRITQLENGPLQPQEKIEALYWASLSRAPSEGEYALLLTYLEPDVDVDVGRQRLQDILWSLLNAKEFALRY